MLVCNFFRPGDVADFQHPDIPRDSIELLSLNLAQMFHRSTSAAPEHRDQTRVSGSLLLFSFVYYYKFYFSFFAGYFLYSE
jgi:hypothetical protein